MDVASEYANQLKIYMRHFSLYKVDIAYLAGTNSEVVSGILKGEKGIVLKTLESIANIFGLRYFEFGNPNYAIATYDLLPEKTKKRIIHRKREGPPEEITYGQNDINKRITTVLTSYKVDDEFLAEEIAKRIFEKYTEKYSVSEVIDRFKKTFKGYIEKTDKKDTTREGRGPKPFFYRLISPIQ